MVEPEKAKATARASSKRRPYRTVNELQELAKENGIDKLYSRVRRGVRGVLSANPYDESVHYRMKLDNGSVKAVLIIEAVPAK